MSRQAKLIGALLGLAALCALINSLVRPRITLDITHEYRPVPVGGPAFRIVVSGGSLDELSQLFSQTGEHVDSEKVMGQTLLFYAVDNRRFDIAEWLLEHGADPNGEPGTEPPLVPAIEYRHIGTIEALMRAGADADRPISATGMTVREFAEKTNNTLILEIIAKYPLEGREMPGDDP